VVYSTHTAYCFACTLLDGERHKAWTFVCTIPTVEIRALIHLLETLESLIHPSIPSLDQVRCACVCPCVSVCVRV